MFQHTAAVDGAATPHLLIGVDRHGLLTPTELLPLLLVLSVGENALVVKLLQALEPLGGVGLGGRRAGRPGVRRQILRSVLSGLVEQSGEIVGFGDVGELALAGRPGRLDQEITGAEDAFEDAETPSNDATISDATTTSNDVLTRDVPFKTLRGFSKKRKAKELILQYLLQRYLLLRYLE